MNIDFRDEAEAYRDELQRNILPWWLKHAIDREAGGLCSCIGDDGTIISYDKYIWSQVRALWTFAAACNRIEAKPEYRDTADMLFAYCAKRGRNAEGDWLFRLNRDHQVQEGPESIQTDAYAICAMVEYARLTGNDDARRIARETFERSWWKINHPGSYRTKPYPIPEGAKAQRVSMQFSLSYSDLHKLTGDAHVRDAATRLIDDVLDHFCRPDQQAVLEYIADDNEPLDPPIGTYTSPGHGVETAWFQIENLRDTGDTDRLGRAADAMRWSLERGWDPAFGGLLLGLDLQGGEPYLPNSDTKIWWPHCEALCGTLMAYEVTGADWCLPWYERVKAWTYAHFPNRAHGEWTQRLNRAGEPIEQLIALPVKDPFHLPRALIYAIESLERLAQ